MTHPAARRWLVTGAVVAAALTLGACGTATPTGTTPSTPPVVSVGSADDVQTGTDPNPGGQDPVGPTPGGGQDPGGQDPGGQDPGTGDDPGTDQPVAPVNPAAEDCITHNPKNLTVVSAGLAGWNVADGGHLLALYDTKADATDGRTVAQTRTRHCFIGRDNHRTDRLSYVHEYWTGTSGLLVKMIADPDCVSYNPSNLTIAALGTKGFVLRDGSHQMLLFDTAADAERGRLVAATHTKLCFIGRGTHRSDRARYVHEYWMG